MGCIETDCKEESRCNHCSRCQFHHDQKVKSEGGEREW